MLIFNYGIDIMAIKARQSTGILLYRYICSDAFEFLLVHPGGPYWRNKDIGAWSVPKGEFESGQNSLEEAKREFEEETGAKVEGDFIPLTPLKQKSGKLIYVWLCEANFDINRLKSNLFETEWPPHSGESKRFPEVDKAAWFSVELARNKINTGQRPFIDEALEILHAHY
jgi:predicted NUDIX family NTP pyrophosphohydrolase